jgi:hypothetical protein
VGVVGVTIYLLVALPLVGSMGFPALVIANTLKDSCHGVILLVLLWRQLGGFHGYTLAESALKMVLAGAAMALVSVIVVLALGSFTSLGTFSGQVIQVVVAGGAGLATYVAAAAILRVEEVQMTWKLLSQRLRPA